MTTTKVGDTFRRTCEGGNGPVYEVTELTPTTAKLPGFGWEDLRRLDDRNFWTSVDAVEQVPASALSAAHALIRRLRDVAARRVEHQNYSGQCPRPLNATTRDPKCEVCAVLVEADRLLGDKVTT
jgi:hypothetical protein